jgi:hypothetical protein
MYGHLKKPTYIEQFSEFDYGKSHVRNLSVNMENPILQKYETNTFKTMV